jgi:hypothetical protein
MRLLGLLFLTLLPSALFAQEFDKAEFAGRRTAAAGEIGTERWSPGSYSWPRPRGPVYCGGVASIEMRKIRKRLRRDPER